MRIVPLGLAAILVAVSAGQAQAMTPAAVSAAFQEGVAKYCLESALRGGGIGALPAELRAGIAPSTEDMRDMVRASNPSGPIWDVLSGKGIVVISEPSADVCEVVAYGAPVKATFKGALKAATKREPALKAVPVTPGYNPIVHRLETVEGGAKVTLDLAGAEPGTPGHLFRFSMLTGKVTRAPAP